MTTVDDNCLAPTLPPDAPNGFALLPLPPDAPGGFPPLPAPPGQDGSCEPMLLADCRLRAATDLFAHTWDPVVLACLRPAPRRRRDLLAAIGGISDKALTETLRRLTANGLVARRRQPAAPPRVEYGLTPLGATLVDGPMRALADWTLTHADDLLAAQDAVSGD